MLTARLKIIGRDTSPLDTMSTWGLVYLDSDKRVGPDARDFESTSYPEEEGEHILPKSVDTAFDYKVKFFIQATALADANAKIDAFNSALFSLGSGSGSGVKTYAQVEFYNDYKRHKIVGYPKPIATATDFWRDRTNQVNDVVIVEWTIRVTKPSLCDFSLSTGSGSGSGGGS